RLVIPGLGWQGPVPCQFTALLEARRIDGFVGVVIVRLEGGKSRMALLTHTAILSLVYQNPADPGTQRRPTFESIQAFNHRHPGVLHHFFSYFPIGHIAHRHSDECAMMLVDQFIERPLVTLPEPRNECVLSLCETGRLDRRRLPALSL